MVGSCSEREREKEEEYIEIIKWREIKGGSKYRQK